MFIIVWQNRGEIVAACLLMFPNVCKGLEKNRNLLKYLGYKHFYLFNNSRICFVDFAPKNEFIYVYIIKRLGVAGAVLQTPLN